MGKRHILYTCKRIVSEDNEYGYTSVNYEKPILHNFLYMPASSSLDIQKYGEKINRIYTSYVPYKKYRGQFNVCDLAYLLDSEMQDISIALKDTNCENANYRIIGVDEQNLFIKITFEKIKQHIE